MNRTETVSELANDVLKKLKEHGTGARFMLGIVGSPGAGKSTVSQALVDEINRTSGSEVGRVVPMDGYHLSNEELERIGLLAVKGIPNTFDAQAFVQLLEQLRENRGLVCAPLFDRNIEASIPDAIKILPEHCILVVEGNYLLIQDEPWHRIRELLDEIWFINTSFDVILPRLIERHRQGGRTEEGARAKVESTDMPNAKLIESTKKYADRLIDVNLLGAS
jgi:pantothenate kinase